MASSSNTTQELPEILNQLHRVLDRFEELDALTPLIAALDDTAQDVDIADTAIGIDANVFLRLSSADNAEDVFDYLGSKHTSPLVLPGQAVQEFWNNQLNAVQTIGDNLSSSFSKFEKEIEKIDDDFEDYAPKIRQLLDDFSAEHGHVYDPATVRKTLRLLSVLKEKALVPFAPRSLFREIANIRNSTKTPPGFRDAGDGDFYIWVDFLYGLKMAQSKGAKFSRAVLVTDDKKIDWSRKGSAHPILVAEAHAFLSVPFEIWSRGRLIKEIEDHI